MIGRSAGPGIADQQLGEGAERCQRNADYGAGGREGGRVVEYVLDNGLDHLLIGTNENPRRNVAEQGYVALRRAVGMRANETDEEARKVKIRSSRIDQIGGRLVKPSGRGDQAVEFIERAFDQAERARGAAVLRCQTASE